MELTHTRRSYAVQWREVRLPMAVTIDDSQSDRSTLRLTLENVSNLPVDFLRLSFDDSTIGPAQAALAEGDLSIYDAYETEYQLINRPVFSWDREQEDTEIPAGKKVAVVLTCNGKVGWYVYFVVVRYLLLTES